MERRTPGGQGGPGGRGRAGRGRPTERGAGGRREPGVVGRGAGGTGRGVGGAGRSVGGTGRGASGATGTPGRSASRPAASRRAAAGGAAKRTRAPEPRRLTGRAAILGMLLLGLLLAYAYPMQMYLRQRAEISELEQRQSSQQKRIEGLAEQRAKWDDPEYVKSQARRRLHYVPPGEVPYVVIEETPPGAPAPAGASTPAAGPEDTTPWYGKLGSSLRSADRPSS